jgi:6-phosphogluconolactonase
VKTPVIPAFLFALVTMSIPLSAAETTPAAPAPAAGDYHVYFGTGRAGPTAGLSLASFDSRTGALGVPAVDAVCQAPNLFTISTDGRHLYTCNAGRTFQGQPGGGLSAFSIDPATGHLTALNAEGTGGADPGLVSLDHTGRFAFAANSNGGSVVAYALKPDGSLGDRTNFFQHTGSSIDPQRQKHAYAEAILPDPTNQFILATDLGLDKIFIYKLDAKTGALTGGDAEACKVRPGSGPRHLAFHPNGRLCYVVSEMANTVTGFTWDAAKGALTELETVSSLPAGFQGTNAVAEVAIHPNGKFLYASNRGHNSLAVFAIDEKTGHLSPVQDIPSGGRTPRCFTLDPMGQWLIASNQDSNLAAVFRVDATTGKLTQTGEPVSVPSPLGIQFLAVPKASTPAK